MEHQASNLIFQRIADVYSIENLEKLTEDNIEWFNTFKNWMKSPILRKHWAYLRYEQHPTFQKFVNKIWVGSMNNEKVINALTDTYKWNDVKNRNKQ